jgi:HEAT repeat protein
MSADFDRFLRSNFFGDGFNALHDGLDVPLLTGLQGEERAQAEDRLLKALPDSRAIIGLGAIRSQKAADRLRKLIHNKSVSTEVAVALFRISGDSSGVDSLINTLKDQRNHWSQRQDAAIALRHFRLEKAANALLDALNDPEKLVRYHASTSLLMLYGQMEDNDVTTTPEISIRMMREGERAAAAGVLRRLVREGKLNGG